MEKITISLSEMIIKDIDAIALELQKFLLENEIKPIDSRISSLVKEIERLKVMKKTMKYAGLIFDSNGYIVKVVRIGDFMPISELPSDISGGYYKLKNGKIVLDEERQRQLEEV